MEKIKNIEFLRVFACITIILFHLMDRLGKYFGDINLYTIWQSNIVNGQKAVDLFFIISGFFFAWKLNTKYDFIDFFKKKIIRLYPVLLFIILLSLLVSLTGLTKWNLHDNLMAFLGLNGTPLVLQRKGTSVNHFWYVSSLLWVMMPIYYARKNYNEKNVNFILAILVFFSYSILLHTLNGKIYGIEKIVYGFINVGLLRAIGGVGVGYFIGEWYKNNEEKIRATKNNAINYIFSTLVEAGCISFIIINLMFHELKYKNQLLFIVIFAICIIFFLRKKGFFSYILNDTKLANIFNFFGKYTYSIYMVHLLIYHLFNKYWKSNPIFVIEHPVIHLGLIFSFVIITGVLIYHFVEEPAAKYLNNKLKKEKACGA